MINVEQGSEEWLKIRHNLITATNVASILGLDSINKDIELMKSKLLPFEERIDKKNIYMIWGNRFEECARKKFESIIKKEIFVPGIYIHNKYKWLAATPDGLYDNSLLEIKCPINSIKTKCPPNYYAQIQTQLEVTNKETCVLFQCLFDFYQDKEEYDVDDRIDKGTIILNGKTKYWFLKQHQGILVRRNLYWFKQNLIKIKIFYDRMMSLRRTNTIRDYNLYLFKLTNINNNIRIGKRRNENKECYFHYVGDLYNSSKKKADPLLDYLNYHGADKYLNEEDITVVTKYSLSKFLSNEKFNFKKSEIEKYKTFKIVSNKEHLLDTYKDLENKTIMAIFNKEEIIINALFINKDNIIIKPDILMRVDVFSKIYNVYCNFNDYVAIDLKIAMNDDNLNDINYIKCKAHIYNTLSVTPKYYILTKNNYKVNRIYEDENTTYYYNKSIQWIKTMKLLGDRWSLDKPNRYELYPNIKNDRDLIWHSLKKRYASDVKDLSLIWYANEYKRINLLKNSIKSYNDNFDLSKLLNYKIDIVRKMLDYSKKTSLLTIEKPIVKSTKTKLFVDYESTNALHTNRYDFKGNMVYLIGVGFYDTKWNYKYFLANSLSQSQEVIIFKQFFQFISQFNYEIIHWAPHEQNELKRVYEYNKHIKEIKNGFNNLHRWIDLCKVFQDNGIFVKNVFNFQLKAISKALYKYRLINTEWDDNSIDGQFALIYPLEITNKINIISTQNIIVRKIIKYNEIDCKVMWDIMKCL